MKKVLSLFAILACAVALVACGGDKDKVENAGEAFELLSLQDLKDSSSADSPIEVEFWHSFGQNISGKLNPLIEKFEEYYATLGIYIDVRPVATGGGYDGLRERVNLGVKSNSIPTMVLGYPDHFASYIQSGILLPLDEYVYANDADIKIDDVNDYYSNYWHEVEMEVNGTEKIVGIPFNKSTEVMYYNASAVDPILKELKIINSDSDVWTLPTWDQVWKVSSLLKERTNSEAGLSWVYGGATVKATKCDYPTYIDSDANFFITATRQWGGEYTRSTGGTTGEVVFNNAQALAAQQYFSNYALTEKLWQLPNKMNQSYGSYLLNNNQAFISIGSTAGVNNNDSTKYELKVTAYPQRSYTEGTQAVIQQGTNAAILSANSNNKTRLAAWLLIRFLTNKENTAEFSKQTGYLPVRRSAEESKSYQAFLNDTDNLFTGNVAKTVQAANAQQTYMFTDPAFSGSSIVRDKVGTMVLAIYCNNKDIQASFDTAYGDLERLKIVKGQ